MPNDIKSTDLLNAIRNGASEDYRNRIPVATRNNMSEVATAIMDYTSAKNEFVVSLLNRIGLTMIKNKLYKNPLREFKGNTIKWGTAIEEVFVDLVKGQHYDQVTAESELYKRVLPDVKAVFHVVNRKDFYKTTVSNSQLRGAFLNGDNGFQSLVSGIIQSLYNSDNYDEFLCMKNLINQYGVEGKFAMIPVTAVTDNATAKDAMSTIKEYSNKLTFMSTEYNYAGVHTFTPKENQIILIDSKFDALIDVELLATAFNMSKADFDSRKVLLDDFGGLTNVLCAIVDKDWFMVFDNQVTTEESYNAQGQYYNYFLHHWQTLSTSLFANAVLFVTVAPELTDIILSPATATVSKGKSLQLYTEAEGTGNPSSKCTFTCDGTDSIVGSSGLLYVGTKETKTTIVVTATSVVDDEITATATITVV